MIKLAGVGVLIALYFVERGFDLPLVAAGIRALAVNPGHQVALVYLACQIAVVVAQLVLGRAAQPLLERLSPPQPHEILGKPRYLYDQAIEDPETALTLVDREEARLFALLPLYFGLDEQLGEERVMLERPAILAAAQGLGRSIGDFLTDLTDTGAERRVLEAVSQRQVRNSLLVSVHESLAELAGQLAAPLESPALHLLADHLREGLGALLLTADEAVRSLDPAEIALMRQLTGDRDSLVDRLRHSAIAADQGLTPSDHRHLYAITSLFELIVWMLRRYSAMLGEQAAPESPALAQTSPLAEALRPS